MISCILRGQLGNQMFQVAATVAHALKHKTDYSFPSRSGKRGQFPFMFSHLPLNDKFSWDTYYREQEFGVYNEILEPIGNQLLQGYFQSELYFKDYRREIIEAFGLPKYLTKQGVVGVHVRRGDYVTKWPTKHPSVTIQYINQAMWMLRDYRFIFFSDDIEWCKQNIGMREDVAYSYESDPKKALSSLSCCEHNIIANSSFSWWAAWLNPNPSKIVIAPHENNWFGATYHEILSTRDIIPKSWRRVEY